MNCQAYRLRATVTTLAIVLLQGCASVTRFEATTPGTTLSLRGIERMQLPQQAKLESKATGQYEFVATSPGGQALYGILPLSVNGATMAGSILLFAPALFIGGFRDVFGFYQMEPEAGVLRYKAKEGDEWRQYKPTNAESNRAKMYFEAANTTCKPGAGQGQMPAGCPGAVAKQ